MDVNHEPPPRTRQEGALLALAVGLLLALPLIVNLQGCGRTQISGGCPPGSTECQCDPQGACTWCGNTQCDGQETCNTCPGDCGGCSPRCGDGACAPGETCGSCPADCGKCPVPCGDGKCDPKANEDCKTCPGDCGKCPAMCGDGACDKAGGETCASCPGDCGKCPPSCGDGTCDPTESCTSCPKDCGSCPPKCGDGTCTAADSENCSNCAKDCGQCCGNGICDTTYNETCLSCAKDCGQCCGDGKCVAGHGEDCVYCAVDCGQCCGDGKCEASRKEDCLTCQTDCGKCCGNKQCDTNYGEDCLSCAGDCACTSGKVCSWGSCLTACAGGAPHCPVGTSSCCKPGQVCMTMGCVTPGKACSNSYDCPKDQYCDPNLKKCVPLPSGPRCLVIPKVVTFKPLEEWSWKGWSKNPKFSNVMVTPVVGDLDADGTPEVIFAAYNGASTSQCMLIVLDGATGKEELAIPHTTIAVRAGMGAAVGNLDGDKELEIVIGASGKGLMVLEHDGKVKWANKSGTLNLIATGKAYAQPSIADVNGDGKPEILVAGVLVSAAGTIMVDHGKLGAQGNWSASTLADLDEDGDLEFIGGNAAYHFTGKLMWQNSKVGNGFPAVADMDGDGWADVVNVTGGKVYVLTGTAKSGKPAGGIIFGPVPIPGGGNGGPPTVGDFDGDGKPEISTAGKGAYTVYDLDCSAGGTATTCHTGRKDGILWTVKTQDISSSVTGSSLFDFEGDGKVEVIYNDECFLRVYDGRTGKKLMEEANTSRTAMEYPLVADVDGDNNSEILVAANNDQIKRDKCTAPGTTGVRVYGDSADLWVRSRPVWNQHAYSVTHVDDDGNIPSKMERNWDKPGLNNFRQNVQGEGLFLAPDLKAVSLTAKTFGCPAVLVLRTQISNVGSMGVAAGTPVSFYLGSSLSSAKLIKTVLTAAPLLPGQAQLISVQYAVPAGTSGPLDFWAVVDDDGTGKGKETECNEGNNAVFLKGASCP